MAIDTLSYAKKLEAAGVDRRQAEAHAEALGWAVEGSVATKSDLATVEARLDGKFALVYWMIGFNLAATMAVLWKLLK